MSKIEIWLWERKSFTRLVIGCSGLISGFEPAEQGGESGERPEPGSATKSSQAPKRAKQMQYFLGSMRGVSQNAEEVPSAKPSLQSSDMYRQVASFAGGQTSRTSRQGPIEGWIESDRTGSNVLVRRQVSESDATATRYLGPAQLQGREDQRRRLRSRQPRGGEERSRMCGVCSKEDEGNNQGQEITKIINQTKKAEGKVDYVQG
ncbi:hypothetical protein FOXYSP1_09173 [Fusarium oxysporum f. sp. phaseoli]